jgi:hypothetical protein
VFVFKDYLNNRNTVVITDAKNGGGVLNSFLRAHMPPPLFFLSALTMMLFVLASTLRR